MKIKYSYIYLSAGIGRTGTYIALDSVTKEGEAEGEVDIFAFVRNMREQRVNMIQTAVSNAFACVFHIFNCINIIVINEDSILIYSNQHYI